MDTKLKYLYAATFVALLFTGSGWFYWFEYIPTKIERECSDYLWEKTIINRDDDFYNKYLKICINSGGPDNFRSIAREAIEQAKELESSEQNEIEPRPAIIVPVTNNN